MAFCIRNCKQPRQTRIHMIKLGCIHFCIHVNIKAYMLFTLSKHVYDFCKQRACFRLTPSNIQKGPTSSKT